MIMSGLASLLRRRASLTAVLLLAAGCAVGADEASPLPEETQDLAPASVSEAWLVELSEPPTARGGDLMRLRDEKERLRAHLVSRGIAHVERYAFHRLWNGVSLHVDHRSVAALRALPGVRAVYPVVPIYQDRLAPEDQQSHAPTSASPGGGSQSDLFTALSMTGADVAQNSLGLTGAGVRVGVIDTGIDINHPDLGGTPQGCFGPGCRIAFGYDFVGDAYDSATNLTLAPDAIPDDCGGHGTHVAGIIGANGVVKGVAPGVTFGAYRVFGCNGTTDSDIMIAAMEMAEADGMRIVNMSIGSAFQWPDYPSAKAADQLVADGVVVVASIGNSGAATGLGPLSASGAPGVGKDVIGVASFDNVGVTQPAFTLSPDNAKVGYATAGAAPTTPTTGSATIVHVSAASTTTTADDGCTGAPTAPAAGSLTGKVALIRRGTCGFYQKAYNAQQAGAVGVVLYNNAAGFLTPTVAGTPAVTIPVVAISAADGALIDTRLQAGAVTLTWTNQTTSTPNPTGGTVSTFSSWGLPADLSVKPDLGAPGGNIYSTYPLELGGYTSLSGTSMASPHTAGAAALLVQARPSLTPVQVRELLQSTAVPVAWSGDGSGATKDPVLRQGSGMIHVDVAAQAPVLVSPAKLALGESAAGPANRSVTLTNGSGAAITYGLSHEPGAAVTGSAWTPTLAKNPATVSFGAPSVTVPAGGSASASFTITADAALADGSFYSGFLVFTPQGGGTKLRVAYAGYQGDYQALPVLTPVTGKGYPWLARSAGGGSFTNLPSGATFTLQSGDLPFVVAHFDHGAARVKIDAYDAVKGKPYGNVLDTTSYGQLTTATATAAFSWNGTTLFNKDLYAVPNGTYVLVLSVLKPLGDPNNTAHWEKWTSPVITLNHP
jgi:subtilisin family serine protease